VNRLLTASGRRTVRGARSLRSVVVTQRSTDALPQPATEVHRQSRFRAPAGSTEVLLVRHGESAPFDPDRPFRLLDGHGDPELAPEGHAQAEAVGARLAQETIHAIYVTTLVRTHQTAAPLAARLGLTPIVEAGLREVHLGEWEGGELRRRAARQDPLFLQMLAARDWGVVPGAESVAALTERCVAALERIHAAHPDERVAVFVHGGVIGALLGHAVGAPAFEFGGADNGSIHHLVIDGDRWHLRCFNDTAHLGPFTVAAEPLT
jgi:probable phosphoglycerate mutase